MTLDKRLVCVRSRDGYYKTTWWRQFTTNNNNTKTIRYCTHHTTPGESRNNRPSRQVSLGALKRAESIPLELYTCVCVCLAAWLKRPTVAALLPTTSSRHKLFFTFLKNKKIIKITLQSWRHEPCFLAKEWKKERNGIVIQQFLAWKGVAEWPPFTQRPKSVVKKEEERRFSFSFSLLHMRRWLFRTDFFLFVSSDWNLIVRQRLAVAVGENGARSQSGRATTFSKIFPS